MIDNLTVFYTAHYNFAAIAGLLVLLALFLASRRNIRALLLVIAVFVVYNVVLDKKYQKNPNWFEEGLEKVDSSDVVDGLWDTGTAEKLKKASENHAQ
jgi:hypothetical protein